MKNVGGGPRTRSVPGVVLAFPSNKISLTRMNNSLNGRWHMVRYLTIAFAVVGLVLSGSRAGAGEKKGPSKETVDKAQKVLVEHLEKIKGTAGQIIHLDEPSLAHCFPSDVFFAVRFRQFPVARQLPEGLNASNIFVVNKEGKLHHLKDNKALQKYFQRAPVKTTEHARLALISWLTLAQEFHQDGMFKFEVLKKDFAVDKKEDDVKAIGRAIVTQGGNGEISTILLFEGGKLA